MKNNNKTLAIFDFDGTITRKDTFRDFNEAGFGALMLDTVSYVGDILSYYVDYSANETFLDTAIEYDNVLKLHLQSCFTTTFTIMF